MEAKIRESFNDAVLNEALKRYGVLKEALKPLDGFENFVYEYPRDGKKYILRISHSLHRDEAAIRGEVDWLGYLAEHGLPVAHAVPSLTGELVERLGQGSQYFSASSFVFAPGQPPRRSDWQNGLMKTLGQYVGRMNFLTKAYQPRDPRAARPHLLDELRGFERFLPESEAAVAEKFRAMLAELATLPVNADAYGLVHQDCHGGNFFVQDGRITMFDFDDAQYAWFAYDVAMALFYVLPHDCTGEENLSMAREAFDEFMQGYTLENTLEARWLGEIPRFLKLREAELFIAIHRSLDVNHLDPWCASFMENRREKILNDVPYVDISFH